MINFIRQFKTHVNYKSLIKVAETENPTIQSTPRIQHTREKIHQIKYKIAFLSTKHHHSSHLVVVDSMKILAIQGQADLELSALFLRPHVHFARKRGRPKAEPARRLQMNTRRWRKCSTDAAALDGPDFLSTKKLALKGDSNNDNIGKGHWQQKSKLVKFLPDTIACFHSALLETGPECVVLRKTQHSCITPQRKNTSYQNQNKTVLFPSQQKRAFGAKSWINPPCTK